MSGVVVDLGAKESETAVSLSDEIDMAGAVVVIWAWAWETAFSVPEELDLVKFDIFVCIYGIFCAGDTFVGPVENISALILDIFVVFNDKFDDIEVFIKPVITDFDAIIPFDNDPFFLEIEIYTLIIWLKWWRAKHVHLTAIYILKIPS